MYSHIMTPVDLGHIDRLGKALQVTADLAKRYGAKVTFVGVTGSAPSSAAHTPEEFAAKLNTFAAGQGEAGDYAAAAHAITTPDPTAELDKDLIQAAETLGADLIVAASHIPSIFGGSSHGGHLASHSAVSVFVVRD